MTRQTQGPCEGPGWIDKLLIVRLEKVQKVGAQSPTMAKVADAAEALANGMTSKVVTILQKDYVQ